MRRSANLPFTILTIFIACAIFGPGRSAAQGNGKHKQIYDEKADARVEIREALARARAGHKRVIVVFGANWCFDCHVLDDAFHSPELAPIIAGNYVVVHIDIGKGEKNQDLMNKYEVPMKRGIPGLAVLEANGKLVYSQKNGEFENARAMSKDDFREFLNKWRPETKNE
ncbi:MAG TPA: thioredoxin family protein [Terriglobales bacterium]|nr:thioredoxin family protein [Terriglobales bacterium]